MDVILRSGLKGTDVGVLPSNSGKESSHHVEKPHGARNQELPTPALHG